MAVRQPFVDFLTRFCSIQDKIIPQDFLASVARASEYAGTRSYDMRRALTYSRMSMPAAPNTSVEWTGSGYPGIEVGMTATVYNAQKPWLPELRAIVKNGFPVIVLQQFSFSDAGGHYRVVYGFNDTHIYSMDPYDREGTPRDLRLSNADFLSLWLYTEIPEQGPRYTGIAASPWSLNAATVVSSDRRLRVHVTYEYTNPFYFLLPYTAAETFFPSIEVLVDPSIYNSTKTSSIDYMVVREGSNSIYFSAYCSAPLLSSCFNQYIEARVSGVMRSSVPDAPETASSQFPPYDWMDIIGSPWTKLLIPAPP